MTAPELLSNLAARGVTVWPASDRLRFRPAEAVPPELLAELRAHKTELLELLAGRAEWPRDDVQRFGKPYAAIFPLLGSTVETPMGPGRLVQVLGPELAAVVLDRDPSRAVFFLWSDVRPAGAR